MLYIFLWLLNLRVYHKVISFLFGLQSFFVPLFRLFLNNSFSRVELNSHLLYQFLAALLCIIFYRKLLVTKYTNNIFINFSIFSCRCEWNTSIFLLECIIHWNKLYKNTMPSFIIYFKDRLFYYFLLLCKQSNMC